MSNGNLYLTDLASAYVAPPENAHMICQPNYEINANYIYLSLAVNFYAYLTNGLDAIYGADQLPKYSKVSDQLAIQVERDLSHIFMRGYNDRVSFKKLLSTVELIELVDNLTKYVK